MFTGPRQALSTEAAPTSNFGPVAASIARQISFSPRNKLAEIISDIWSRNIAGLITDDEAERLDERARERERSEPKAKRRRQIQRRYYLAWEARVHRRRMLGSTSIMPPEMRAEYTQGELSVLAVVAPMAVGTNRCQLSNAAIADRAGVGRTTVQNTLRKASRLLHLAIIERRRTGQTNLTNVIHIVSGKWIEWLQKHPSLRGRVQKAEHEGEKKILSLTQDESAFEAGKREEKEKGQSKRAPFSLTCLEGRAIGVAECKARPCNRTVQRADAGRKGFPPLTKQIQRFIGAHSSLPTGPPNAMTVAFYRLGSTGRNQITDQVLRRVAVNRLKLSFR